MDRDPGRTAFHLDVDSIDGKGASGTVRVVVRDDALVFPSPNGGTNVFRFKAILDHHRYVAIFPEPLHSLDLLTHDPLSAPR